MNLRQSKNQNHSNRINGLKDLKFETTSSGAPAGQWGDFLRHHPMVWTTCLLLMISHRYPLKNPMEYRSCTKTAEFKYFTSLK
jgi:hypothetical protein